MMLGTKSAFSLWAAASLLLTALVILESSAIAANECPPVGASADCGTIITINNNGSVVFHTGQPPYDRDDPNKWPGDDTLVGIRNNSSSPIRSIGLRAALPIFGEDFGATPSDGICGTSFFTGLPFNPRPTDCPSGPMTLFGQPYALTGYEGPGVFFTNLTSTEGTVIFEPPITPGGTRFFGLEAAISAAVSCPDVINNSIQASISNHVNTDGSTTALTQMNATFTPGLNPATGQHYTTSQAATICGFTKFNWISKMRVPNPSPYFENLSFPTNITLSMPYRRLNPYDNNLPGNPNPPNTTSPRLTETTGAFNDPPKYGYTNSTMTRTWNDWYPYPFYWDMRPKSYWDGISVVVPNWSLFYMAGGQLVNYNETSLSFNDTPSDPCLFGGNRAADGCNNSLADPGDRLAFTTRLAGVLRDVPPTGVDLGIGFTWTSSYNGYAICQTTTGTDICATSSYLGDLVPDSGTGGITITGVQNISNYNYNGIVVTTVNGVPTGGETTPPAIMVSATPMKLWPPNHRMVPVTVSGTMTDNGPGGTGINPSTAAYVVTDEYGLVQPAGAVTLGSNGSYSFTIQLQASRKGNDKDGRQYLITVSAEDNAGNKGSSSTQVIVPHDQGHDRKDDREHDRKGDRDHDERDDPGHDHRH
jgi:hypothetical protein